MSKLDATLLHALALWRMDLAEARGAEVEALAAREVTVVVSFIGDVDALRAGGFEPGYPLDGRVSGGIALRDIDRLAALDAVKRIALQATMRPLLDTSVKDIKVPWKVGGGGFQGRGTGVIVAVIDTGIDIFHESFRLAGNRTRILEYWDQGVTVGSTRGPGNLGTVFSKAEIEAALPSGTFASLDTNGHGTHSAGVAAGNGQQNDRCSKPGDYFGVAPDADLVIVRAIALPAGARSNTQDAITWAARAGARHLVRNGGPPRPVVVNCSFGDDLGAHDGEDDDDRTIESLLRPAAGIPKGIAIVASAGNSGGKESHESGIVPPGGTLTLSFQMPTGSVNPDYLAIWYDPGASLTVDVIAPPAPAGVTGALSTGPVAPQLVEVDRPVGRMRILVSSSMDPIDNHTRKRILITIRVPATFSNRPGAWRVVLTETRGQPAPFDAWLYVSNTDGSPSFRMDTESGPPIARRREHTIKSPGSARSAITVAAYDESSSELAPYSSRWLPPPSGMAIGEIKPTIAAPGVAIKSPRSGSKTGQKPSSCCDQRHDDFNGTSAAAPHVAGVVALMFEKNPQLTFEEVRAALQRGARIDGIPAAEQPSPSSANHLWGAGKIDARAALEAIPAPAPGGGGPGGGTITAEPAVAGMDWRAAPEYTPHTIYSRLGVLQRRIGPRPGFMLAASLISVHVDEVLRLINTNARVGAVWRRRGGPLLVRHLLNGPAGTRVLPDAVEGCDVATLIQRFLPILTRYGSDALKADVARYGGFACAWPGAEPDALDAAATAIS